MRSRIPLAVAAVIATAASGLAVTTANAEAATEPINLAYYSRSNVVGNADDFYLKEVHESGAAADLTHLAYAFAEVELDNQDPAENGELCGTADWGDYNFVVPAEHSVDGVADQPGDRLAGQFHQLAKLKELHPDLKVTISLGGGGGVGGEGAGARFTAIAADPALRARFIEDCVDTFLRGDLPLRGDNLGHTRGGPGAAYGVFDGIDIDWEWSTPDNRDDYAALHTEFRAALDAYGAEVGRHFSLNTTFPGFVDLPATGVDYDVAEIFAAVDFATVQGYGLHAAWGPGNYQTNHQAQLFSPADDPAHPDWRSSAATAVTYLLAHGAPAEKIVLGVPAYAEGWTGVPGANLGLYQVGTGPAAGSDGHAELYDAIRDAPGAVYIDFQAVAAYKYDGDDWWSYDTPQTIAEKTRYALDNGLGGMMMWQLLGDRDNDLVGTIAAVQAAG
ncbi:chitinase [Stackebrandtia albiflava]|uniref:chitinase n=1 Tax=Stackebrandtia albiflava TaxID=406432 RepID=A0A562VDM8_9ACTN|nr:glycosyl hydrolase family 18 protein [Stackebrandtia albiflava]TWJ15989.1 chitinase [Stackebrandtia albiflava]